MAKMGMEHYAARNPIALPVEDMETARGDLMLHHRYAPREN